MKDVPLTKNDAIPPRPLSDASAGSRTRLAPIADAVDLFLKIAVTIQVVRLATAPVRADLIESIRFIPSLRTVEM